MGWDSDSHILLTAPVSLADISFAAGLGGPPYDLGYMMTNGSFNKWAKYKGCEVNTPGILTEAQRKNAHYGLGNIPIWTRYIGHMRNFWYGIDTSSTNQPTCGLASHYWEHIKPTTWFRALDHDGYYSRAEPPVSPLTSSGIYVNLAGDVYVSYPIGAESNYTIKYSDLGFEAALGSNMYFGIMFRNGNTVYYKTREQTISAYWSATIGNSASGQTNTLWGTWEVFPFLSNVAVTSLSSDMNQQGTFVALLDPQTITISRRVVLMLE